MLPFIKRAQRAFTANEYRAPLFWTQSDRLVLHGKIFIYRSKSGASCYFSCCLSFHPYRAQYIINLVSYLVCASFCKVSKPLCAVARQNSWPIAHANYRAHCNPVPIGLLQLNILCLWVSFRSRYFGRGTSI